MEPGDAVLPARIALAVDPSDPARPGLRHACFLASATGADLVLLPIGTTRGDGDAYRSRDGDTAAELAAAARRMASVPIRVRVPAALPVDDARGHRPRGRSRGRVPGARPSSVVRSILSRTRRAGAQVLVMPRGERWAGALYLLQSVAERVIARASLPVLVVPDRSDRDRATVAPDPRILLLEPRDPGSRLECLRWAAVLAHPLEATVLSARPGAEPPAGHGLRTFIGRHGADLVVVAGGEPGWGGGAAGLPSDLVSAAVRTAPCPVLVVPGSRSARVHLVTRMGPPAASRHRPSRMPPLEAGPTDVGTGQA